MHVSIYNTQLNANFTENSSSKPNFFENVFFFSEVINLFSAENDPSSVRKTTEVIQPYLSLD